MPRATLDAFTDFFASFGNSLMQGDAWAIAVCALVGVFAINLIVVSALLIRRSVKKRKARKNEDMQVFVDVPETTEEEAEVQQPIVQQPIVQTADYQQPITIQANGQQGLTQQQIAQLINDPTAQQLDPIYVQLPSQPAPAPQPIILQQPAPAPMPEPAPAPAPAPAPQPQMQTIVMPMPIPMPMPMPMMSPMMGMPMMPSLMSPMMGQMPMMPQMPMMGQMPMMQQPMMGQMPMMQQPMMGQMPMMQQPVNPQQPQVVQQTYEQPVADPQYHAQREPVQQQSRQIYVRPVSYEDNEMPTNAKQVYIRPGSVQDMPVRQRGRNGQKTVATQSIPLNIEVKVEGAGESDGVYDRFGKIS